MTLSERMNRRLQTSKACRNSGRRATLGHDQYTRSLYDALDTCGRVNPSVQHPNQIGIGYAHE
jgi:hypothetical protein